MSVNLLVRSLPSGSEFSFVWSPRIGDVEVLAMFEEAGRLGENVTFGPVPLGTNRLTIATDAGLFESVPIEISVAGKDVVLAF